MAQVTAGARSQSLAWELTYAIGGAIKRKKKKVHHKKAGVSGAGPKGDSQLVLQELLVPGERAVTTKE